MGPFKVFTPTARWILRFSLIAFIGYSYFEAIKIFNFNDEDFLIASGFYLSVILLFVGAFTKTPIVTSIAGLGVFSIYTYLIVKLAISETGIEVDDIFRFLLPMTLGFYFFATGNKRTVTTATEEA